MGIGVYQGERQFPLQLTAASQLLRNRVVKVTNGVPAYPGYGDEAVGYTSHIGDGNDFVVRVNPLRYPDGTFRLQLAGTVAAHNKLVAVGSTGCVKTADHIVKSRSVAAAPTATLGDKYLVPAAGWSGNANAIATGNGSTFDYTAAATDMVVYVTAEDIYLVYNGTAWVRTKALCRAAEAGTSGAEIVCYPLLSQYLEREAIPATEKNAGQIVCCGVSASETDADATVTITDARILNTDFAVATAKAGATAASLPVIKAVCTAGTLTITLSGNGGAGTIINYIVFRSNDA